MTTLGLPTSSCTQTKRPRPSPALWSAPWPFFAQNGIVAQRLMTDNGFSDVKNRSLRELLARHGIHHLTTQPYRPRTNGKVERFHQTMAREWAYGLAYRSHHHRNHALPYWLDHYNRHRPHSSLGNRPPSSRIHNVRG
jgi:transposase InsO family protein